MAGAPVGRELERYSFRQAVEAGGQDDDDDGQGSIMMVVATDAPLSPLKLERLAKRAVLGLARTGSFAGNGSGDCVVAFSTAAGVRRTLGEEWTESRGTEQRPVGAFRGHGGGHGRSDLQLAPQGDDRIRNGKRSTLRPSPASWKKYNVVRRPAPQ